MPNKQGMTCELLLESARFATMFVIIDVPLAIIYSRFTLSPLSRLAASIMILEGATLLIAFALSTSRSLMSKYIKETAQTQEPLDFKSTKKCIRIPRGTTLLLCAMILIILGFFVDLIAVLLKRMF